MAVSIAVSSFSNRAWLSGKEKCTAFRYTYIPVYLYTCIPIYLYTCIPVPIHITFRHTWNSFQRIHSSEPYFLLFSPDNWWKRQEEVLGNRLGQLTKETAVAPPQTMVNIFFLFQICFSTIFFTYIAMADSTFE